MKLDWMLVAALGAALAGCGDNSKKCGDGTEDVNGTCVGTIMCTDGTILDQSSNSCVIDPNSCQDGTVLMGGKCVDPAHQATDITEAMEPNGLGLFGEDSTDPAGEIELKPVGQHFTIKGKIAPFQDGDGDGQKDADVDTYIVVVEAPSMLSITADGLHGLAAGFVSVAAVDTGDPLDPWVRFGINLVGDTSKRQVFLPAAGVYAVGIADTRTIFLAGGAAGPAEGAPDFEYYVTVDQQTFTPTALTVDANGAASQAGKLQPGETKVFSVPMGLGINTATLNVSAEQANESLVVTNTRAGAVTVKRVADGDDPNPNDPAAATIVGIKTGDTQLVVADTVYNYAAQPIDFTLGIQTGGAGQLSDTGGMVSQPGSATDFSVYFYDVATANQITGMDLSWSIPVVGVVVDQNFSIFANFTFDPVSGFQFLDTWTSYKGLLHHKTAGRYYFLVFDPATTPAAMITATSTYAAVPLVPVASAVPLTAQTINQFTTNPFSYDAGVSAWEAFKAGADAATLTGNITGTYIPLDASFGRLDPLVSTCTVGATDFCADVFPVFKHTYAEAGTTVGRILLDDATKKYLVTMRPTTVSPLPQIQVDFRRREHVDLGTIATGAMATRTGDVLSDTVTVQRYLLKATNGNGLSVSLTPQAGLNTRFQQLNKDETNRGAAVNNGGDGVVDLAQFFQAVEGWTAFTATSVAVLTGMTTFDLVARASAAVTYNSAAGTTAFSDACTGGTAVTMQNGDEGYSTATINVPAGFDFFGFATTSFKVNSNGFLTFDTSSVCSSVGSSCFFSNATIPAAANPNGIIAPYWDDIITTVCQKTAGTKLIIQWSGTTFTGAQVVKFQAILDGANDTIEFVYDATHVPTGTSATVGLENQVGSAGKLTGFNTANSITPGTAILYTPM